MSSTDVTGPEAAANPLSRGEQGSAENPREHNVGGAICRKVVSAPRRRSLLRKCLTYEAASLKVGRGADPECGNIACCGPCGPRRRGSARDISDARLGRAAWLRARPMDDRGR